MVNQMLIAAVVPAADDDEALSIARGAFDRIAGRGATRPVFESYRTVDQISPGTPAGRWGDLPVVAAVDAEPGAALLERQWAETCTAFASKLDRVRAILDAYSTREIMRDVDCVRSIFKLIGTTEGPLIYLYDEHGLGIQHRQRLDSVLEQDEPCWIVPAAVRY